MKLAILVLVILNIISLAFATSTNMPAVIWQGEARKLHKPAHISSCTSTSLVNFVSTQISSTQQPKIIVSFVHPAVSLILHNIFFFLLLNLFCFLK